MLFTKGRLQIIPDSPDVVVYGSPREARSAVITGRVVYATCTPRAVTSLVVRFRSKHEELFNPAMSVACQAELTAIVVKDGRVCAPSSVQAYDEASGQQEWRFALSVPGNVSETVFTPSAFVAYELMGELRTSGLMPWMPFGRAMCTTPLAVKRVPAEDSLWAALAAEPLDVAASWRSRLELSATAASRIVNDAQTYHVTGVVRPLAKGVRLLRAAFELRETIDGPFDADSARGHAAARCSHELCLSAPSPNSMQMRTAFAPTVAPELPGMAIDQEIQVAGALHVPRAYGQIQYDIAIGPIRVSHEVVFIAQVAEESGEVHSVRLSTGVYVLPCTGPPAVDLPRYENSAKDVLLASTEKLTSTEQLASAEQMTSTELAHLWAHRANDNTPPPEYCAVANT
ncbi:hypothetical protein IWW46_005412 [Coemansia sp. RSA 2440]|nr:hypothetical protein IWW46_005412 [Coemansia sp. RSA 2440]KAJ2555627.1 hypothetical protein IWW35_000529 [Coemansia sp. RSA 1878]